MIEKPYWTNRQISILEFCFDEIRRLNLTQLKLSHLTQQGYKQAELLELFKDDNGLITELVKYWAWKETWEINQVLITIKNPFRRLLSLVSWGFRNNRYLKLYLYILRMQLTDEAIKEIDDVNRRKHEFLRDLFIDRGLSVEQAEMRSKTITPFYYGWVKDKDDYIKSDVQKFDLLSILKTMLFPELFRNEKPSVKEL
jgi:hypothetical protein